MTEKFALKAKPAEGVELVEEASYDIIKCAACSGLGGSSTNPCPVCDGARRVRVRTPYMACSPCGGLGGSSKHPCQTCQGIGVIPISKLKTYG